MHPTKIQDNCIRFIYVGFRDIPGVNRKYFSLRNFIKAIIEKRYL